MRRTALVTLVDAILLTTPFIAAGAHAQVAAPAATGSVDTGGAVALSTESPAPAPAADNAPVSEAGKAEKEARQRWRDMRTASTELGAAGGIFVVDAAAPARNSLRMQAMTGFFVKKDYLYNDDKHRFGQSALSVAYVPYQHVELTAATSTRVSKNDRAEPAVLQSVGNLHFGAKGGGEVTPGVALGGDLLASFLNGPGDAGINFKGTTVGLRGNLGLDLRKLTKREVPLQMRANFSYVFDNSAKMIRDTERARFGNLVDSGTTSATEPRDEFRHLVRRDERLGLGISRVDVARIALGLEAPLEVNDHVAIHPIAEWQLDIPVNRQDFDCPVVTTSSGGRLGGTDSCLADENIAVWHQHVTLGARVYPYAGLSILAGIDIGVGGAAQFVQELAPNAPYRILLGAAYNADLAPRPPVIREVEKPVEVPVEKPMGRLRGTVLDHDEQGVVVAGAQVSFPDRPLNPLLARADGTFDTYTFEPGDVRLALEAEGYEPANCSGAIPVAGGDVNVSCTMHALPKLGSVSTQVTDDTGASVPGVNILLAGPESKSVLSDAYGKAHVDGLKPGSYRARVEQDSYLLSNTEVEVKARADASVNIVLVRKPKSASVTVSKDKIKLRGTILFATATAQIENASTPLLTELADTLLRHPEILRVEVQGHTDDRGDASVNVSLSQQRADAVKSWLVGHGVEADRLTTKGMGAERPLAPNLTEAARAKNRRVELVIQSRAGQ